MTTGTRKPGEFCWINMLTPQPAEAREFFGKLLGWSYFEMPGIGHGVQVGGNDIGGLFDLEGPNTPVGTPPLIGVMVKVESADATCAKVTALGGKAKPAFDIMDQGRMAVCFDPNGAEFDVWEPKKMLGTAVDSSRHGAPSWFETMTTDVDRASKFYSGLFGWTPEVKQSPGFTYTTFKNGATDVAGMLEIAPSMGEMRPHWVTYFTVTDAEEAAREAVELGATLCRRVQEVPGVGRFCGITSPQGVTFCVIEYTH
jgi:predicted enzyme related to lactoylglutathione lyase